MKSNILKSQIEEIDADFDKRFETLDNYLKLDVNIWQDKQIIDIVNSYKGNLQVRINKYKRLLTKRKSKEIEEAKEKYANIMNSKDFGGELVVTVEWKMSAMWGANPKAYTNYGFEGSSIGGCGYCKLSTATAEALNSHKPLLKMMYERINKELQNPKKEYIEQNGFKGGQENMLKEVLGYGSGRGVPYFERGVGVSSHQKICENLGLEMKSITSTNTIDVFVIKRV